MAKPQQSSWAEHYGQGIGDDVVANAIDAAWGQVDTTQRIAEERKARSTAGERRRKKTRTKRLELRLEPDTFDLIERLAARMPGTKRDKTKTAAIEEGIRLLAEKMGVGDGLD